MHSKYMYVECAPVHMTMTEFHFVFHSYSQTIVFVVVHFDHFFVFSLQEIIIILDRYASVCVDLPSRIVSVCTHTFNTQTYVRRRSAGVFTVHVSFQLCRRARENSLYISIFYLRRRMFSVGCWCR